MVRFNVSGDITNINYLSTEKIYLIKVAYEDKSIETRRGIKTTNGNIALCFNKRCHLMVGDYITATVFTTRDKDGVINNKVKEWQVYPEKPLQFLRSYIKRALLNNILRKDRKIPEKGTREAKLFWRSMHKDIDTLETLLYCGYKVSTYNTFEDYLTHLATQTCEKYKSPPDLTPFNSAQVSDVLRYWHWNWNKRRLLVLGLPANDILNCHLTTDEIWDRCNTNPHSLIMFKESDITNIQSRLYTEDACESGDASGKKLMHNIGYFVWGKLKDHTWADVRAIESKFGISLPEIFSKFDPSEYFMMLDESVNKVVFTPEREEVHSILEYIENMLNRDPLTMNSIDLKDLVSESLSSDQLEAFEASLKSRVCIISGAAGTGKTTLTRHIIKVLEECGKCFVTTSFMGKACARLNSVTDDKADAKTMHKLLVTGDMWHFKGTVIIDEASTVSQSLLYKFLHAYGENIEQLIMIGDVNQLQPIEWGAPFEHLYNSKKIPIYTLTTCHRQSNDDDGILYNARMIIENKGRYSLMSKGNLKFIDGDYEIIEILASKLLDRLLIGGRSKILTPRNDDVKKINKIFQDELSMRGADKHICKDNSWYVGDPVMATKNTTGDVRKVEIFNGMEGYIKGFVYDTMSNLKGDVCHSGELTQDLNSSRLTQERRHWAEIKLDNGETEYIMFPLDKDDINGEEFYDVGTEKDTNKTKIKQPTLPGRRITMNDFKLSYALTIDKSQGSEWDHVVIYIPKDISPRAYFYNKKRLYVAMTRAKSICQCVGDLEIYRRIAGNHINTPETDFEYHLRI